MLGDGLKGLGALFNSGTGEGRFSPHIERMIEQTRREFEALGNQRQFVKQHGIAAAADQEFEIEDALRPYEDRRLIEMALAQKMVDAGGFYDPEIKKAADAMVLCRHAGAVGIDKDAECADKQYQVAWNSKCGYVRFCPDEAREDAKRVANKYQPELQAFRALSRTHSLHYAVLTLHNFEPGRLEYGKRYIFERFRKLILKRFPNIAGALVVLEDPLSVHGDWNVHLNVIFCVKGALSWKDVRAAWGFDIHFELLPRRDKKTGEPQPLGDCLRELVKYAAKMVDAGDGERGARAPGLLDYPNDLFLEWLRAQFNFRRVRAYGCLYAAHRRRWTRLQEEPAEAIVTLFQAALTHDPHLAFEVLFKPWSELTDREKVVIGRAMDEGARRDIALHWVGAVSWHDRDARYIVDSVPGDIYRAITFRENTEHLSKPPTGPPELGTVAHCLEYFQ